MAEPLLSIVTPCLNAARFLPRALGSVASQAAPGLVEHIIIDGASTDGSRDLIEAHARAHPGLVTHWRSAPDRGQSDAINAGLALARGRYGAWLNADDWYEPGALARVLEALRAGGAEVVVGRCRFVDERGRTIFRPRPPEPISLGALLRLKSVWFNGRGLAQPEAFFRLDRFRRLGGLNPDNHHTMDYDLWVRLLEAGARFAILDADVACHGAHAAQKTADNRAVVRSILGVATRALERNAAALGAEAAPIRAELGSMARKLALADAVLPRWELALRGPPPAAAAPDAFVPDPFDHPWPDGATRAVSALARRLARAWLFRRSLSIATIAGGRVRGAALVLERLGRKRLDVALIVPAGVAEESRGELARSLDHDRHTLRLIALSDPTRPAEAGLGRQSADLVIVEEVLGRAADPAALLAAAWSLVRPGGRLLQLPEPRPTGALPAHLRWLIRRVSDQLSANDDGLLNPAADAVLRLMAAEHEAFGGAGAWLAAHPGAMGIEISEVIGGLSPAPSLAELRRFGSLDFHPLAPFRLAGPRHVGADTAWSASLWRKPT